MSELGSSGVAMLVTQPAWPTSVPRMVSCSAMARYAEQISREKDAWPCSVPFVLLRAAAAHHHLFATPQGVGPGGLRKSNQGKTDTAGQARQSDSGGLAHRRATWALGH